jgi:hypothetical protein
VRLLGGISRLHPDARGWGIRMNGQEALAVWTGGALNGVMSFTLRGQRIAFMTYVVNPDKLPTLDEMAWRRR